MVASESRPNNAALPAHRVTPPSEDEGAKPFISLEGQAGTEIRCYCIHVI